MGTLLPFDEINALEESVSQRITNAKANNKKVDEDQLVDDVLDLLIMSYVFGNESANKSLETSIEPDVFEMKASIYKDIAGKNWEQRVREYANSGDYSAIQRVIETDAIRVYNESSLQTAQASGVPAMKTWQTMLDDRVRDTHDFLEGVSIPLDAEFYSFDGDSARYPGDFSNPANNINCRCTIGITKMT